ncbi:hypothetical protein NPIL_651891 [Nephila pilipes]|uniref:Uncharacterized protein n=1 Tax=Nephila pilipes TaxID=299642 RepID=A0A8X6P9A3_NEPPI|nr:hypothetical protein NPIL_651891 [Nephila pilipes]
MWFRRKRKKISGRERTKTNTWKTNAGWKNSRKIAHRTGSDYENGSEVGNHKNNEEEENLKEPHPSTAGFQ